MQWWLKEEEKEFYWKKAEKILRGCQVEGYVVDRESIAIQGEDWVKVYLSPVEGKEGSRKQLEGIPEALITTVAIQGKNKKKELVKQAYLVLKRKRRRDGKTTANDKGAAIKSM